MFKRLIVRKRYNKIKVSFNFSRKFLLRKGRLKRVYKWKRIFTFLEKRERFTIQTLILTGGLITSQFIWQEVRLPMVIFLSLISYLLTWWSLKEDIKGIEWFVLFLLPVLFTASLALFYFLLPPRMITRVSTTAFFAIGTYAILLVENIYNVASNRSIQLLRAAQSVGLLLTLTVVFLSATVIFSLSLPFYLNFLTIFTICFFLSLQSFWSVGLPKKLTNELILYSLIVALGAGELALAFSFWPVENATFSLMISATYYSLVGVVQQYLSERLFMNIIREYIIVFVFTLILSFMTTKWG